MIEELLPPSASAAEHFGELPDEFLFPEEEAAIARAVAKRRREFRTVRGCARVALAGLGLARGPMVPGERGAPPWPRGVVGSMTHCAGYCAAAVAEEGAIRGIGIDAEPHEALPQGVAGVIELPAERRRLARLTAERPDVHWDRLLFSAKESVYKAWFPVTGRLLGFEEALIRFDPVGATFGAEILSVRASEPPLEFAGRFMVRKGLILTAATAT